MARYRAFHLGIESSIPLPELPPAPSGGEPDLHLLVTKGDPGNGNGKGWGILAESGEGQPWILWRADGEARVLLFPGLAEFRVEEKGRRIRVRARGDLPPETLRHLFLDTVLPCVLDHRGNLVLHGSAVQVGDGAVAFVGDSGAGKSTLAAAFALRGFPVIGDDALLIEEDGEGVHVVPAYPGLRLWPDSPALPKDPAGVEAAVAHYTDKRRLSLPLAGLPHADRILPLRLLLILSPPEEKRPRRLRITPLSRSKGFLALIERCFFLDPEDRGRMVSGFQRMAESSLLDLVKGVSFPRGEAHLRAVLDGILAEAGG